MIDDFREKQTTSVGRKRAYNRQTRFGQEQTFKSMYAIGEPGRTVSRKRYEMRVAAFHAFVSGGVMQQARSKGIVQVELVFSYPQCVMRRRGMLCGRRAP